MTLLKLQNQLRAHIRRRIQRGELTGVGLARAAGFPQGHLSNFLNSRRGLSLESMDRLLKTLRIGVLDLLSARELQRRLPTGERQQLFEPVFVVAAKNATLARFAPHQILETHSFATRFLHKLKPSDSEGRRDWLRFVLIRLDQKSARAMFPFESDSATLLVDRHYSSLEPYHRSQPNLYAVMVGRRCMAGYLSLIDRYLVVRPHAPQFAMETIRMERGRRYSEYIVGRVCHVGLEI